MFFRSQKKLPNVTVEESLYSVVLTIRTSREVRAEKESAIDGFYKICNPKFKNPKLGD